MRAPTSRSPRFLSSAIPFRTSRLISHFPRLLCRSHDDATTEGEDEDQSELGGDHATLSTHELVATSSLEQLGCFPHPDPIAESASLSSVDYPSSASRVKLCLPLATLSSLSAPQIQFLQVATKRHQKVLAGGNRAGFLLGDGAGVGKGRQAATLIPDLSCHPDPKP